MRSTMDLRITECDSEGPSANECRACPGLCVFSLLFKWLLYSTCIRRPMCLKLGTMILSATLSNPEVLFSLKRVHFAKSSNPSHGSAQLSIAKMVDFREKAKISLIFARVNILKCIRRSHRVRTHILEDFENASPYFCTFLENRTCD